MGRRKFRLGTPLNLERLTVADDIDSGRTTSACYIHGIFVRKCL